MNRLQKKCFVAATGVHLLLLLILLVGPAFLVSPETKVEPMEYLEIFDAKLIDQAFSGGGNPNAVPPPVTPPPQEIKPPVQPPPKEPELKREIPKQETLKQEPVKPKEPPPKETKRSPDSLEAESQKAQKPKERKFTPIKRANEKTKAQLAAERKAQEADAARKRLAAQLSQVARSLKATPSTTIEPLGPGGGGEVYMSYDQFVQGVYYRAWEPPEDTTSDDAVVRATVTIASNGNVTFSRIQKSSGDAAVDRSVLRTLDRVRFVAPFPKGAKDKERTYNINFNLKAKRLAG